MNTEVLQSSNHDVFVHIRIIIGMILGISVARLISGAARFMQNPAKEKIYLIHFGWVIYVFLFIVHFWWFEFALSHTKIWTFLLYILLISYSIVFVLLSAMLFPDQLSDYKDYKDYFIQRRNWFYALLLVLFCIDVLDTLIKGRSYYIQYGLAYPVRQTLLAAGAVGGIAFRSERYDAIYVALALVAHILWVFVLFNALN